MKIKFLLTTVLCFLILIGYSNSNQRSVSSEVNYSEAYPISATIVTSKDGENFINYSINGNLDTDKYHFITYQIFYGNGESSEELFINKNQVYKYKIPNDAIEGSVWKGYIIAKTNWQINKSKRFEIQPVQIPAINIDADIKISEPQEDGTVFTITSDIDLNPSTDNKRRGDIILDNNMRYLDKHNPRELKVKIDKKAIHKIKINLTNDNVREYELQVGTQQYPASNVSLKDLTNVHAKMRKVFTDNIYLDLIHPNNSLGLIGSDNTMNIDYSDLSVFLYHSMSLTGAETSITSYDDHETIKVYASGILTPIPNTYVIYGFKISNNFYSQTGVVEMMLDRDGLMTNLLVRDHEVVDGGPCVTWDPPKAFN
ncbi:hypothetical protein B4919_01720 [Francisella tularensis subsp. novicida]|uniref:hypothetical protein n=1 Tax=Francisella tularensis TaxID=263 RepID=UPI000CE2A5A4|nr:hypothetical protein [Francisella tularensis]AVC43595.1 hypothetical protein B4919_01720 [Francisella tularensis subsp. novicida]